MTTRQKILRAYQDYWLRHNRPPTMVSIAAKVGITERNAWHRIESLVKSGELKTSGRGKGGQKYKPTVYEF